MREGAVPSSIMPWPAETSFSLRGESKQICFFQTNVIQVHTQSTEQQCDALQAPRAACVATANKEVSSKQKHTVRAKSPLPTFPHLLPLMISASMQRHACVVQDTLNIFCLIARKFQLFRLEWRNLTTFHAATTGPHLSRSSSPMTPALICGIMHVWSRMALAAASTYSSVDA